jgi:hypothetical protein
MATSDPLLYLPTPTDVARLLRARTTDSNGTELGDWSEDTRPTAAEVADLIDQAAGPVLARVGRLESEAHADLIPAARHLVALGAAMIVASERSAYASYQTEYADCQAALIGDGEGDGGALPGASRGHASVWVPSATVAYSYGLADGWGSYEHWPEPENPANWRHPAQPPREPPLAEDLPVGDEPASGVELR